MPAIHKRRVSIPSVAVAEFASAIFERFNDKFVLVIGAGEMGRETTQYLLDEGSTKIVVVNRSRERAEAMAAEFGAAVADWTKVSGVFSTDDGSEEVSTWMNDFLASENWQNVTMVEIPNGVILQARQGGRGLTVMVTPILSGSETVTLINVLSDP